MQVEATKNFVNDHGHIGVVDDDPQIRLLVTQYLRRHGFQVSAAGDAKGAMELLQATQVDLLILDVMLPGRSGLDLCREIRATLSLPVIMLTARGDEDDRIVGLEVGADDYVTKPFSPRELLARIRAVLRRIRGDDKPGSIERDDVVRFDGWMLDLRRRELVSPSGTLVDLSTGEFDLLNAFIEHPNRILTRDALLEFAKARSADTTDRVIDVQVSRLRKKLAQESAERPLIKTVRGVGYMFAPGAHGP
ncbi:response regulator transcription factor [Methylocella sp. CPCC 101449]|jgi:two-component system OmpR family response regulator|uniref:response regulator transcription factor n=1 Tax=Methylocella sp. CPCC 101449 TaxID=2987531 RepID=UPI00288C880E|nr:response regulator transcription factor [Methylocella sp. CPCC 101449]MDT2023876.1 response regulator transcription factor [Methylocella sp. CPCC 101449]HEV2573582.1 response regulator transcription factor [Beijerinckiaceae bacterium]